MLDKKRRAGDPDATLLAIEDCKDATTQSQESKEERDPVWEAIAAAHRREYRMPQPDGMVCRGVKKHGACTETSKLNRASLKVLKRWPAQWGAVTPDALPFICKACESSWRRMK